MRKAKIRTLERQHVRPPAGKLFIRCTDDPPEVIRDMDDVSTALKTTDVVERFGPLRPARMHPHSVRPAHFAAFIGLFGLRDDDPTRITDVGVVVERRDRPWVYPGPKDADGNSNLDFEVFEPASSPKRRRQLDSMFDYGPNRTGH